MFKIRGYVVEKESGNGLPGLIVKIYDQDLLYDDLLGDVKTDDDGSFRINYEGGGFQELFDKKPSIRLRVRDENQHEILVAEEHIQFEDGETGFFWLEIAQNVLQALQENGCSQTKQICRQA